MMVKIVRSRAPLRLGLGGGGTDIAEYSSVYGGCVLNATINMYARTSITTCESGKIRFIAQDLDIIDELSLEEEFDVFEGLSLHRAVYRRIMNDFFDGKRLPVAVVTSSDAPPGSGLGSSSAMVVSIITAFMRLYNLPLSQYDLAKLAFEIERIELCQAGGAQDQYAASFGGFNFMEFSANGQVIVNPLRVPASVVSELESSMFLYYTGISRFSSDIIEDQKSALAKKGSASLDALHEVKRTGQNMKQYLLTNQIQHLIDEVRSGWEKKKETSSNISNPELDGLIEDIYRQGGKAVKISGAGGGGFMMVFVDPYDRNRLIKSLADFTGKIQIFSFEDKGAYAWTI